MSTILITGSRGFLGRALRKTLSEQGYTLLEKDVDQGDLADSCYFDQYKGETIDRIFHLAAKTYVPDSWEHPMDFYRTNVLGTENVLEFCRRKKIKLTYVSAYVYGQPDTLPIKEDSPVKPNNHYAQSKYLAEQLCRFYATYHNVAITVIRPFNIYGPGQNPKFLIPHIVHQALCEDVIRVQDLHPKRDYVYIDDVIDALLCTISAVENYSVYNIGSGYSLSVREVIDVVQDVLCTSKPVVSEQIVRHNEMSDVFADISKAKHALHWVPKHSFREGITKTIRFEKGNGER